MLNTTPQLEGNKMKKTPLVLGASALLLFGLTGCGSDSSKDEKKEDQTEASEKKEKQEAEDKKDDGGQLATKDFKVSYKQAVDDFNKANKGTKLLSVQLNHSDDDDYKYRIVAVKDDTAYRAKVNAEDGKVEKAKKTKISADDQNEYKDFFDVKQAKEPKEAVTATMKALKDKYGLKAGHATSWKLIKDGNQLVYHVKVRHILREYHATVDAKTLKVLSTEKEFY